MSYPSGSTLLVGLQNGASPNTGPFDIYINDLSSSSNLIANDVSKATLSGSGYTFVTPLETFRVWAKSDSTITNADVAILGEVPGFNKSVAITGSYDSSLNVGQLTSDVFLDNGYGMQTAGNIPSNLNTCPSTTGTGTGSINSSRNTLVTVKTNETSSNYVKFFPNGAATSVYYYHLPSVNSSGTNETSLNICVDLVGGVYQTVPTNSINVYPSTTDYLTLSRPANFLNSAPYGNDNSTLLIRVNGALVYSGSSVVNGVSLSAPPNSLVEVTSSILQTSVFGASYGIGVRGNFVTNSLNVGLYTTDGLYTNQTVFNQTSTEVLLNASSRNDVACSFTSLPGAEYYITATHTGNLIYAFLWNGGNGAYSTRAGACAAGSGGGTVYSFWSSPVSNNTVYYNTLGAGGLSSPINVPSNFWINLSPADNVSVDIPQRMNGSLVIETSFPCP
jgi:hypothetical protein